MMKYKTLIIAIFLLGIALRSFSQKQITHAIYISHVIDNGDGIYNTLIGTDVKTLNSLVVEFKLSKTFTKSFIVSKDAFDSLEHFMAKKNILKSKNGIKTGDYIKIKIISNDINENYILLNKSISKKYFQQLLDYLKNSNITNPDLIKDLRSTLKSLDWVEPK